jgi:hypothetical protein
VNVPDKYAINYDQLFKKIPLKWGKWIYALLKMCLQKNPMFRASAEDVHKFLILAKRDYK